MVLVLFIDVNARKHQIWLQVFGFLMGIDLQGMSGGPGGAGEDSEDQMRGVPTPPPPTQAQSDAQQAKEEEEEEVQYLINAIHTRTFATVAYGW